jgi:uncharacterized protein YjbJ (UPF0337 family)
VTRHDALEAEGASEKQSGRARRKASGALHEAAGTVKRTDGDAIDLPTLEAEGEVERRRGQAERA